MSALRSWKYRAAESENVERIRISFDASSFGHDSSNSRMARSRSVKSGMSAFWRTNPAVARLPFRGRSPSASRSVSSGHDRSADDASHTTRRDAGRLVSGSNDGPPAMVGWQGVDRSHGTGRGAYPRPGRAAAALRHLPEEQHQRCRTCRGDPGSGRGRPITHPPSRSLPLLAASTPRDHLRIRRPQQREEAQRAPQECRPMGRHPGIRADPDQHHLACHRGHRIGCERQLLKAQWEHERKHHLHP
jgi:hypothetical protein